MPTSDIDGRYDGCDRRDLAFRILKVMQESDSDMTVPEIASEVRMNNETVLSRLELLMDRDMAVETREVCHTTLYDTTFK